MSHPGPTPFALPPFSLPSRGSLLPSSPLLSLFSYPLFLPLSSSPGSSSHPVVFFAILLNLALSPSLSPSHAGPRPLQLATPRVSRRGFEVDICLSSYREARTQPHHFTTHSLLD